ncbi:MAC/perforin domain-containing protein [Paracholeplasma manati]|uniref:MAC/perforin domain-containing protein n=1 Tax=Paracholeplasma manati TaxID=591373 RepID=UPI0024082B89|nr:MAC/perforin domain-containing protein [Paracholeplasma manati]MDG0889271.1 MAC/perforin domain-containing protein [Paracholeplasma manati]
MKKILMVVLVLFILTGCQSKKNPNSPIISDEEKEPLEYGTNLVLNRSQTIDIFDSIYLVSLDNYHEFSIKTSIFDATKIINLNIKVAGMSQCDYQTNTTFSMENEHLSVSILRTCHDDMYYLESYSVLNYGEYLSTSFLQDMTKLNNNEMTSQQFYDKYGTHFVVGYMTGFHNEINLQIESRDLNAEGYGYLKQTLLEKPVVLPISDELFQTYASISKIQLTVVTSSAIDTIEEVLNKTLTYSNTPTDHILAERNIVPIYKLYEFWDNPYPNAIAKLESRYYEMYPNLIR